jgi:hypothetical protein
MADPVFKAEMARATAAARAELEPKAITVLGELLVWQGEGRAADANVRLNAAKTILGEEPKSLSVNMNVQNNLVGGATQLGYVLRLPANLAHERPWSTNCSREHSRWAGRHRPVLTARVEGPCPQTFPFGPTLPVAQA